MSATVIYVGHVTLSLLRPISACQLKRVSQQHHTLHCSLRLFGLLESLFVTLLLITGHLYFFLCPQTPHLKHFDISNKQLLKKSYKCMKTLSRHCLLGDIFHTIYLKGVADTFNWVNLSKNIYCIVQYYIVTTFKIKARRFLFLHWYGVECKEGDWSKPSEQSFVN